MEEASGAKLVVGNLLLSLETRELALSDRSELAGDVERRIRVA